MKVFQLLFWLLLLSGLVGCTITLKKDAEFGLRFGTDIALYHNAPDDGAQSELNATDWVVDLINSETSEVEPAPEPLPDVPE